MMDATCSSASSRDSTPTWKRFAFYLAHAGSKLLTLPLASTVTHAERLPPEPYIVAANHRSLLDAPYVVSEFNVLRKRAMHMIGYKEPFDHPILGPIIYLSGCLPFDRGDPESRVDVLRLALGYLATGEPVGVFPEAHLSRTDRMRRGRPGVAILALESGAPVVPVAIRNAEKVLEPGTQRLRFGQRAEMEIGHPLTFADEINRFKTCPPEDRADVVETVIHRVMRALADLAGQTYPHPRRGRHRRAK